MFKTNTSFDCLILFKKKLAFFCQITVRTDKTAKINETFQPPKFNNYVTIIEKMKKENIIVKYILIHGDHEKKMKHFRKNSRKKIYFFLLLHQDKHTLNILKTKLKISQKNA